jgi:hypothetical protein
MIRNILIALIITMTTASALAYTKADWKVAEIGGPDSEQGPYKGGEVKFLKNGFIISATGGDIWSNKLGCTLAYIDGGISGDFTIGYTIVEHTTDPPTTWSKVGAMVAQDLKPDTPYVFLQSTSSNDPTAVNDKGTKLITRPTRGGSAGPGSNGWTPLKWPVTYKLVRKGDLFTASVSFDGGKKYESIADPADGKEDNTKLKLKDPVILGIAINGHNSGQTTGTATVVDIKIDGKNAFAVEPVGKLTTTWATVKWY